MRPSTVYEHQRNFDLNRYLSLNLFSDEQCKHLRCVGKFAKNDKSIRIDISIQSMIYYKSKSYTTHGIEDTWR